MAPTDDKQAPPRKEAPSRKQAPPGSASSEALPPAPRPLRLANGVELVWVPEGGMDAVLYQGDRAPESLLRALESVDAVMVEAGPPTQRLLDALAGSDGYGLERLFLIPTGRSTSPGGWAEALGLTDEELLARVDETVVEALVGSWPRTGAGLLSAVVAQSVWVDPGFVAWQQQASGRGLSPEACGTDDGSFMAALRWVVTAIPWLPESPGGIVGAHLVTAALLSMPEEPLVELLGSPRALDEARDAWFSRVSTDKLGPNPETWPQVWHTARVPLPSERRPVAGYASDAVGATDQLNIDPEARALARLIVDKDLQPPLSIGLLGDWGSGKSFFMARVDHFVDQLTAAQAPGCIGSTVDVRFNAWHACDESLWPALVRELLGTLRERLLPTEQASQEELRQVLRENQGRTKDLESRLAQLKAEEAVLQVAAEAAIEEAALRKVMGDQAAEELQAAARKAGLGIVLDTTEDLRAAATAIHEVSQTRLLRAITSHPWLVLLYGLLVLAGVVGLAFLGQVIGADLQVAGSIVATVFGLLALVSHISQAMRTAADTVLAFDGRFTAALDDDKVATQQRRRIAAAREKVAKAQEALVRHQARMAELEAQIASLDPFTRLAGFLGERLESQDYLSRRGLLSIVREDLEALSGLLSTWRKDPSKAPSGVTPIERIVVYVDDLDRCPPAAVVQMLEAIHLLLSVDLFVVIAAVDSRWLSRSLEVHYRELLGAELAGRGDNGVSARSYLEKIFQLPYALAPMDPAGFRTYVDFLLPEASGGPARPEVQGMEGLSDGGIPLEVPEPAGPTWRRRANTWHPLEVGPQERAAITALLPLLPTPRTAKRLVNVYRLVKASQPAELQGPDAWPDGAGVAFLLAVLFGKQDHAEELYPWLVRRWKRAQAPDPGVLPLPLEDIDVEQAMVALFASFRGLVGVGLPYTEEQLGGLIQAHRLGRYSFGTARGWWSWGQAQP